jgi:hypothetical protein
VVDDERFRLGTEAAHRLVDADCCENEPGLSDAEFSRIEAVYGFRFSADHRAFLAAGLPVASPFEEGAAWKRPWPAWRSGASEKLRYRLRWPVEGVLTAVENGWWHEDWDPLPPRSSDALAVAERKLAQAPVLVPVHGHRFVPAGRGTWGHPLLSVAGGLDIICYGRDLADYVDREFGVLADEGAPWDQQVSVSFWKDFLG